MRLPSGENDGSAWIEWVSCHARVGSLAAAVAGRSEKTAIAKPADVTARLQRICGMAASPRLRRHHRTGGAPKADDFRQGRARAPPRPSLVIILPASRGTDPRVPSNDSTAKFEF